MAKARKQKTHKSIAGRITRTKKGKGSKILMMATGKAHFNARESSKKTRNKRSDKSAHKTIIRNINRVA